MVDYLDDIGLLYPYYRLLCLIMVHHDYPGPWAVEKASSGYEPLPYPVLENTDTSVLSIGEYGFDLIIKGVHLNRRCILIPHQLTDRG